MTYLQCFERLERENATLNAQLSVVRSQSMSLEVVKTDDERFKRLTGLPNYGFFAALVRYFEKKVRRLKWWRGFVTMKVLCTPSGAAKQATREYSRRLSVEQFFAVLVRLRTALSVAEMAHQCGVSPSWFSSMFTTWVNFLAFELSTMHKFPSSSPRIVHKAFMKFPHTRW